MSENVSSPPYPGYGNDTLKARLLIVAPAHLEGLAIDFDDSLSTKSIFARRAKH